MIAVEGDITEPGFGLPDHMVETIVQEVSVVFNVAATVKFDEHLRYETSNQN